MTLARLCSAVVLLAVASLPMPAMAQGELKKGDDLYQYWCATCHGDGPGHPGTTALAAKYKGALPGLLEARANLTSQGIRFAVRRGTSIMPFFRKTELSDADVDAVIRYLTRPRAAVAR